MTATPRTSPSLVQASGRDYADWFALLDDWGATTRDFRSIADFLVDEHGLSDWWAQKLIVEYQQARGLREPGARADGTFTVSTSKTIGVPADRLLDAFVDPVERDAWLVGVDLSQRVVRPGVSARFDADGGTRVNVVVTARGVVRASISVEHVKLADAATAEATKQAWRDRLATLAAHLED